MHCVGNAVPEIPDHSSGPSQAEKMPEHAPGASFMDSAEIFRMHFVSSSTLQDSPERIPGAQSTSDPTQISGISSLSARGILRSISKSENCKHINKTCNMYSQIAFCFNGTYDSVKGIAKAFE